MKVFRKNKELWDLFTKKEEYNPVFIDKYDRFTYHFSKYNNPFYPKLSEFLIKNGFKIKYPGGKKFAVCLTHDVDILFYRNIRLKEIIESARNLDFKKSLKILYSTSNKDLVEGLSLERIMDLEEKYDAKSSFYFLSLNRRDLDFNYHLSEIKDSMKKIIDRGFEVGLHGGHSAFNNLERLKKEKSMLEKIIKKQVIGYRSHYLRFNTPGTWEILSKSGFKYDTSFGYPDCVGFRNGMCHPFKPFNLNTDSYIDIFEIPLVFMDSTIDRYMLLDYENSLDLSKKLVDTVEGFNGVITFLFHNNKLSDDNLKLYDEILKYCKKKNAWMTSAENIFDFYKEKNLVKEE